jgi:hypothetical protein
MATQGTTTIMRTMMRTTMLTTCRSHSPPTLEQVLAMQA